MAGDHRRHNQETHTTIQLGKVAPDFEQESTIGKLQLHEYLGADWDVLFRHPKDFTPVCTTELAEVARLKRGWPNRHVKATGLSGDPADSHQRSARDTEETQGRSTSW
jgi:thioredoxin-dependent peroxiredoxin